MAMSSVFEARFATGHQLHFGAGRKAAASMTCAPLISTPKRDVGRGLAPFCKALSMLSAVCQYKSECFAISRRRPTRLEDLQCLNLRYRATSFLCVPVPRAAPDGDAASPPDSTGAAASEYHIAFALAEPLAAGCLTLGLAEGVCTSVLE